MTHTRLKFFVFLALLLLTASNATASPMGGDYWEFNAYANADAVADILNALSGIVKSGGFKSIYLGLAVLGLAISAGTGLIGGNPKKLIGYFVGFMLLTYTVFGLKVTVFVKEMVYIAGSNQSGHRVIGEVPGAIAIPMASISYLGTGLTNLLETYMSKPITNNPSLPEGVLPFGAKAAITKDMTELRITDPNVGRNFKEWVAKCVVPRLVSRQMSMNEMAHSRDLMAYFKNSIAGKSQVTFVQFYTSDPNPTAVPYKDFGGVFSCFEGITQLEKELKAHIGDSLSSIGKRVFPQYARDALLSSDIATSIADDLLGRSAGTATNMAMQGAIIDVVNGVGQYQAEVLGADSTLLAMNINNAQRSQKTGWYTASVLFRDMSSYMYAAIQVFLMGIAPLIIILMLIPGMGAKLGGSYMKAVVWLASWWPALHIVNFMMESYYANSANSIYSTGDDAVFGLSLMNAGASSAFSDNMIIAIGFMATLVPTLMWGIINGTGMALTSMLDRASGASYASSAAQDAAAGNFRAGSISTNTYSANKYDDMQTRVTGRAPVSENYAGSGINQSANQGGQDVSQNNSQIENKLSQAQTLAVNEAWANTAASGQLLQKSLQSAAIKSATELSSIGENASIGKNGDVNFGTQETAMGAIQNIQQLAHSAKHMNAESWEAFENLAAGFGFDFGFDPDKEGKDMFKGKFSLNADISSGGKHAETITATVSDDGSMTFTNSNGEIVNLTYGENSGSSITSNDIASSTRAYQETDTYTDIESKVDSYTTAQTYAKSLTQETKNSSNVSAQQHTTQRTTDNLGLPGTNETIESTGIKPVNKSQGGDGSIKNDIDKAPVEAAEKFISSTKATNNRNLGDAETKHRERQDSLIAQNLALVNGSNKGLVQNEVINPAVNAFKNGESNNQFGNPNPEYLNKLQPFSIGGNKFDPAGMVRSKEGNNFDMVYRTPNAQGEHEYYAVGDKGSMSKLNNLEYGDRGQVFFSGAQINQFDNHAIGELGRQDVPLTKDNIRAYQESLKGHNFGFGNSISVDAGSHIQHYTDHSVLNRFPDEERRSGTDLFSTLDKKDGLAIYMQMHLANTYKY